MWPNRIVTVLSTLAALIMLGVVVAAPPTATSSKTKPAENATTGKADGSDSKTTAKDKVSDADDGARSRKVIKTDAEWAKILTREQYRVTRKKEMERQNSGNLWKNDRDGVYVCVCCGQPLFDSKSKFDGRNGYPCFSEAIDKKDLTITSKDERIECSVCDANLGQMIVVRAIPPGHDPRAALGGQPSVGPPTDKDGRTVGKQYGLYNQSIKFIPRADFEKARKKAEGR
jgi:peptide-methionine (R)-S-oxide reductase